MSRSSAASGIVLYAKQPGMTSFASLFAVKRALCTGKVGHTGTLDSFACGLLVVCAGSLTRFAGKITAFDKTYEAIISFGTQTDTLDPGGAVIKNAPLPSLRALQDALKEHTGRIMQAPPAFSAVHVGGRRASGLARSGRMPDIPARPVEVYSAELLDHALADGGVRYAHVRFSVSKGTYIRCLARDIASSCGSAAHLAGLFRTRVGGFCVEDAAGFSRLRPFSIASALGCPPVAERSAPSDDDFLSEIRGRTRAMSPALAQECGLVPLSLTECGAGRWYTGKPIRRGMFVQEAQADGSYAVFESDGRFAGVCTMCKGRLSYDFVVPR